MDSSQVDKGAGRRPLRWVAFFASGVFALVVAILVSEWTFDGRSRSTVLPLVGVAAILVFGVRAMHRKWPLQGPRNAWKATGAVVLGVALAFGGSWAYFIASESFYGHCGLTPTVAYWTEPGLYDALPPEGAVGGLTVVRDGPPSGLPFMNATLAAALPGSVLHSVTWSPPTLTRDQAAGGLRLHHDGGVRMAADDRVTQEEVGASFMAFARNVTTAADDAITAWTDDLINNVTSAGYFDVTWEGDGWVEREVFEYSLSLDGPWRLDDLWSDIGPDPFPLAVLDAPLGQPGKYTLGAQGWGFDFVLPTKAVEASGGERIVVDPRGAATAGAHFGEVPSEEFLQRLQEAFQDLDGMIPGLHGAQVSGYIC